VVSVLVGGAVALSLRARPPAEGMRAQLVGAAAAGLKPPASPIPSTLFGLHIHRLATTTPWPAEPFDSFRMHDAHVAWPNLEPSRGVWQFAVLDDYVALAASHDVELVLPLELTPKWASSKPGQPSAYGPGNAAPPRSIDDWTNYVRTVGQRYQGRIHYYEIWNEPNLSQFYSGSVTQMVLLAQAASTTLKQIDPTIQIVGPSTVGDTSWIDSYFASGGTAYCDIVGYHFYVWPNAPETMQPQVDAVRAVMGKYGLSSRRLWNTEAGWFIYNQQTTVPVAANQLLDWRHASAYVARAFVYNWLNGIDHYHFYAWDDTEMGLTEADGVTLKPPAIAYGQAYRWLVGATLTGCASDASATWSCAFTRPGGYAAWMVWNASGPTSFSIPSGWSVTREQDLAGSQNNITGATSISIDITPILLEHL
jgi:hypothetical protein